MAAPITNPPAINGESKSARKKKAKAEVSSLPSATLETPPVSEEVPKENGHAETHPEDTSTEHVHIKELQKQIRNINKKLTATHKADSVLTENPGVSLDDLVAQRKLNNDQKASILKKPQLQAQLGQLEEQIKQFRDFEADFKQQLSTQKRELEARHEEELSQLQTKLQEAQSAPATTTEQSSTNSEDLGAKVLIFSQFLRTAASKRAIEEDASSPENMAFEGALLLVYGGDDKAVEAALNLIEGADLEVPGIDGELLPVKYSQIKNASIAHSAQPIDDSSAPSTSAAEAVSDPTISHAGLTELDDASALNGSAARETAPGLSNETSNLAGERWDTTSRQDSGLEEGYEIVPRPNEEVDTPVAAPQSQEKSTSWADDTPAAAAGNTAGENWDTKIPQQGAASWADETAAANPDDGFQQIPNRPRGRGGRGRGDGENRGRGGRGRGGFRGEFRGGHDGDRGRGGPRGSFRGNRGDGERGGRGGRGRGGPRGDATAAPRA